MILRCLNAQGIAGIAISICLGLLLVLQKGETSHWRKESARFEHLNQDAQARFAGTVANYRAAAEAARAADKSNAERVAGEQRAINERTSNDYEGRLADARARFDRLRIETRTAAADPRRRSNAAVPGLSAPAIHTSQSSAEDGLPDRLLATEQAIQLDELIKWVRAQASVAPGGNGVER